MRVCSKHSTICPEYQLFGLCTFHVCLFKAGKLEIKIVDFGNILGTLNALASSIVILFRFDEMMIFTGPFCLNYVSFLVNFMMRK
jgi:hypothetical protein